MRSIVSKQVGSCEQVYFCKSSCNLLVDWYRFLQYAGVRLLTTMLHVNCISCHEFFLRSSCPKKEKKKKKSSLWWTKYVSCLLWMKSFFWTGFAFYKWLFLISFCSLLFQGMAQGCISGICSFANLVSPLAFSPLTGN